MAAALLAVCDANLTPAIDMRGDVHVCGGCHVILNNLRSFLEHRVAANCSGIACPPPSSSCCNGFCVSRTPLLSTAANHSESSCSVMAPCEERWSHTLPHMNSIDNDKINNNNSCQQTMANDADTCSLSASLSAAALPLDSCIPSHSELNYGGGGDVDLLLMCSPQRRSADLQQPLLVPPPPNVSPVTTTAPSTNSSSTGNVESQRKRRVRRKCHTCSICGHQCAFPKDLQRHMFKHKDEKFACEQCDRVYNRPDKLNTHIRLKHNTAELSSTVSQSSINPAEQRTGGTANTVHKTCLIPECTRTTTTAYQMKKHLQIYHSDIRPYSCQICSYSAKSQHRLNVHLRSHTGDSPYQCDSCGRSFKTHSDLVRHKRVHTGSKPFQCQHCSFSTAYAANLRVHTRRHHADTSNTAAHSMSAIEEGCTALSAAGRLSVELGGAGSARHSSRKHPTKNGKHKRIKYLPNFSCEICHKTFVRDESYRAHMQSSHKAQMKSTEATLNMGNVGVSGRNEDLSSVVDVTSGPACVSTDRSQLRQFSVNDICSTEQCEPPSLLLDTERQLAVQDLLDW